jgi:D-alanyl-D-alanine carboxypeptidase
MVKNDQFSGALLVGRHGKVLLQKAGGRASREAGIPNTLDTQFRNGSMNKMFTAVATLQLVDAGKITFDDPVGKHVPDYPNRMAGRRLIRRRAIPMCRSTFPIHRKASLLP